MTVVIKPLIAGNWKMNGLKNTTNTLVEMAERYGNELRGLVDLMICPPATLLLSFCHTAMGSRIQIGGQDCHANPGGAHTGDISAEMIADAGASAVIVGHSERRADHGETDAMVHAKALSAHRAGLLAIICVGETKAEREAGKTLDVVAEQLAGSLPDGATSATTTIAYEPVWAIGTGLTPTAANVADVHAMIRMQLVDRFGDAGEAMRILYGGSVKPSNASELLTVKNVNGALVGGASLKADDFLGIADIYR